MPECPPIAEPAVNAIAPSGPCLPDELRSQIRYRHYSLRTERAYVQWVRALIRFHGLRHPALLTRIDTQAAHWPVAACYGLVARLLYSTGMRLLEGLRLRVKDVDFERRAIIVRSGKGAEDRVVMLPAALESPQRLQMQRAKALWRGDCEGQVTGVEVPHTLRHSFVTHRLLTGYDIRTAQALPQPAARAWVATTTTTTTTTAASNPRFFARESEPCFSPITTPPRCPVMPSWSAAAISAS